MTSKTEREVGVLRGVPLLFWVLAVIAVVIWSVVPGYTVGWDLNVYKNAAVAMKAGLDPYVAGMNVQRVFHATLAQHPNDPPPYTYVYSPMTLPLVRWIALAPFWSVALVYWTAYIAATFTAIWFCWQAVEEGERKVFSFLAPAVVFFPGLLQYDVLFSGNVAVLLYGLIFSAAVLGWRRGQWTWFYAAVLLASCCKAPMLSLLAIPVFSARRQWWPVAVTGAAGVGLFLLQPLIWPELFQHYLEAVELQFSFNHDFSSSPAGLLADKLYYRVPYQVTSAVSYAVYALVVLLVLWSLSRRYLAGRIAFTQWMPVLLLGTILLNPRIMEYDIAPVTLLMAVVTWRLAGWAGGTLRRTIVLAAVFFAVINLLAAPIFASHYWRLIACCALVGEFGLGAWMVWVRSEGLAGAGESETRSFAK